MIDGLSFHFREHDRLLSLQLYVCKTLSKILPGSFVPGAFTIFARQSMDTPRLALPVSNVATFHMEIFAWTKHWLMVRYHNKNALQATLIDVAAVNKRRCASSYLWVFCINIF